MSMELIFGDVFKPEIKSAGIKLFRQERVSIPSGTDTSILVYIRTTPAVKVEFSAVDVADPNISTHCSCAAAKKNQFCKHIWAALLATEEKYPDFLSSKQNIKKSDLSVLASNSAPAAKAKARASEYRKEQYQKVKERRKFEKTKGRPGKIAVMRPAEVEVALEYFKVNGFLMGTGPSAESLSEAKRTLSRLFHPDRGGSNDEMVELNHHADILIQFLRA